jgi:hypothetical protein
LHKYLLANGDFNRFAAVLLGDRDRRWGIGNNVYGYTAQARRHNAA